MRSHHLVFAVAVWLFPFAAFASFSDVPDSHINHDAIMYVQSQGIVSGYPDGTFRPDQTINRAEFLKIVMNGYSEWPSIFAACADPAHPRTNFSDTPADQWYSLALCKAWNAGFVAGYSDGTFRPATSISFVEAAKIIAKVMTLPTASDPVWYKPYVDALAEKKAIPSSIHSFDQLITRGEMAEIIYGLKTGTTRSTITYDSLAQVTTAFHYNNQTTKLGTFDQPVAQDRRFLDCINGSSPDEAHSMYYINPDGTSAVYEGCEDSGTDKVGKKFIVVNGQVFGGFDSLQEPLFSADGKHLAFIGFKDGNGVVYIDGEISPMNGGLGGSIGENMAFSPDGKFIYIVKDTNGQALVIDGVEQEHFVEVSLPSFGGKSMAYRATASQLSSFVIFNGQKGKEFNITTLPVVSSDGKTAAYIGISDLNPANGAGTCTLVVGDKESPYACNGNVTGFIWSKLSPIFFDKNNTVMSYSDLQTQDGFPNVGISDLLLNPVTGKYDYIARSANGNSFVVREGVADKEYMEIGHTRGSSDIVLSADGMTSGYIGIIGDAPCHPKSVVVINGQEVRTFTDQSVNDIALSPDGKHVALETVKWLQVPGGCDGSGSFLLDGQEKTDFIKDPVFSADSSHFAYIGATIIRGQTDWREFIVIDGVEGKKYDTILTKPVFIDEKHIGYAVRQNNEIWWIVDPVGG